MLISLLFLPLPVFWARSVRSSSIAGRASAQSNFMCCHLVSTPVKFSVGMGEVPTWNPNLQPFCIFRTRHTNECKCLEIHIRTYDRYAGWPTHTPVGHKAANGRPRATDSISLVESQATSGSGSLLPS